MTTEQAQDPLDDLAKQELSQFIDKHEIKYARDESGKTWYSLADICKVLGNTTTSTGRRLQRDAPESAKQGIIDTGTNCQYGWLITDDGLTEILLSSRHPAAKAYRRWLITNVIIPMDPFGLRARADAATGPQSVELNDF